LVYILYIFSLDLINSL